MHKPNLGLSIFDDMFKTKVWVSDMTGFKFHVQMGDVIRVRFNGEHKTWTVIDIRFPAGRPEIELSGPDGIHSRWDFSSCWLERHCPVESPEKSSVPKFETDSFLHVDLDCGQQSVIFPGSVVRIEGVYDDTPFKGGTALKFRKRCDNTRQEAEIQLLTPDLGPVWVELYKYRIIDVFGP